MRWMKEKVEEQEKEKEPPVRARQQVASRESPATRRCACGEHVTGWLPWETAARYLCRTVRDVAHLRFTSWIFLCQAFFKFSPSRPDSTLLHRLLVLALR